MNQILIFDLDDTLFETKSIGKKSVKPIFDKFEDLLIKRYGTEMTEKIIPELWKFPFDFVCQKYKFDNKLNSEFAGLVNDFKYQLSIKTFEDFEVVKNLPQEKILVTTGFFKLQSAKIRDLGIAKEFGEIYIDNILDPKRIHKKGIFKNIMLEKNINQYLSILGILKSGACWVPLSKNFPQERLKNIINNKN